MAFGDVNLSEEPIRGNYNPGAGGWPTIRYFNKATGLEGAPYTKKTSGAMCDELGNDEYMQAYVEEAAQLRMERGTAGPARNQAGAVRHKARRRRLQR